MRSSAAIFLSLLASVAVAQIPDFSNYPKPPPKYCDDDKGCSFACTEEGCLQVICDGLKCTRPNGWHFEWTQEKKDQFMKEGVCRIDPATDDEDLTKCFRRCTSTSDCSDEEYCNLAQNACQEKVRDEDECKADTDCESLSCVSGKCGSNVGKDCQEDTDCPAINGIQGSRLCSKTTKKCLAGNVATGKQCSEDAQCGSGCCKEGTCQYCKKCSANSECPFSLECLKSSAPGEEQKTCQVPPPPPPPECHLRVDCEGNVRCFKSPDSDLMCNPGDGSFDAPCRHANHCQGRMKCFDGKCGFRGKNCGNERAACDLQILFIEKDGPDKPPGTLGTLHLQNVTSSSSPFSHILAVLEQSTRSYRDRYCRHVEEMVDLPVSIRLRRAIVLNDVLLVKRILRNNPTCLENTDFDDKSNTSLHLAAIVGHLDIIKLLVEQGHDSCEPNISKSGVDRAPGISLNTDSSTPLHLAALNAHPACTEYLCTVFPQTINHRDKNGATPLMLAAQSSNPTHIQPNTSIIPPRPRPRSSSNSTDPEDTSTISVLLNHSAPVDVADYNGNTVLHYASTWGNLKAFRLLVGAGAPPFAKNNAMCTAADYALGIQAAVYCRSLIAEFESFKNGGAEVPLADQQKLLQQRLDSIKPNLKVKPSGEFALHHLDPHMSPISPTDARLKDGLPNLSGSPRAIPPLVSAPSVAGSVRMVAGDEEDSDVASSPEDSGIMRTESIDADARSRI